VDATLTKAATCKGSLHRWAYSAYHLFTGSFTND